MAYKTALENLQAANKLLVPSKWITDDLAVDCNGRACAPRSPKAEAFCALGAVQHIDGPGEKEAVEYLRQAAFLQLPRARRFGQRPFNADIFEINDRSKTKTNFKKVKDMFRLAIRLAKKGKQ